MVYFSDTLPRKFPILIIMYHLELTSESYKLITSLYSPARAFDDSESVYISPIINYIDPLPSVPLKLLPGNKSLKTYDLKFVTTYYKY